MLPFPYQISVSNILRKPVKSKHIMPKIRVNSLQERSGTVESIQGMTPFSSQDDFFFVFVLVCSK